MLRPQLDAATRKRLKLHIDAYRRAQIRKAGGLRATRDWTPELGRCKGCGIRLGDYLVGCSVCDDRRWKREQRQRQRERVAA
jgi:hypothetical protein